MQLNSKQMMIRVNRFVLCSIVGLFILTFTLSCETDTLIDLPLDRPKLVINFIGSTDYPWKGRVGISQGILEDNPEVNQVAEDVKIRIYEEGNEIDPITRVVNSIDFENSGLLFGAETASPQAGKIYKIEAELEGYDPVSSTYTQPFPVVIETLKVKRSVEGPYQGTKGMDIVVTFNDPVEQNYYAIILEASNTEGNIRALGLPLLFADPSYKENSIASSVILFNDDLFNGKTVTMAFTSYIDGDEFTHAEIQVRTLSKEYYGYEKTRRLQEQTVDDPYAQPVKVINNIDRGFGIFGGYAQTTKTCKIE